MKHGRDCSLIRNLRPVSLTSYIGKVYEKLMVYRLGRYVMELDLLSSTHFAYCQGRSSIDCLQYVIVRIERNMQLDSDTHAIFYGLSSAYDTVQHSVLLWKLEPEYFISGIFLETLHSFLSGRYTQVKTGGTKSGRLPDRDGVPQGGALSPLLYLLYVDNVAIIDQLPGIYIAIYSDDIVVLTDGALSFAEKCRKLQFASVFITWYAKHHGLRINTTKTKYKIFETQQINE